MINTNTTSEKTIFTEKFTSEEKREIANKIKPISLDMVEIEYNKLKNIGKNAENQSPRSRIGNSVVDYFTFLERLHTRGKYNCNYFEFIHNIDFVKINSMFNSHNLFFTNCRWYNKHMFPYYSTIIF